MRKSFQNLGLTTRLGLALGGGGARGVAHIGVLRAFEHKHIKISCMSGTSAGAIVAALYAFGKSTEEIRLIFDTLTFSRISNLIPVKLGLSSNQGLAGVIEKELGAVDIQDAPIPLSILCTDLITGESKIFTKGPLAKLVQASCSFPGIYSPVEHENMLLVDGALTENIPVSAAKQLGANFVVAVSLSDIKQHVAMPSGMLEVMNRCFDILVDQVSLENIKSAEYTIYMDLSFMSRFKLSDQDKAINLGFIKTQRLLEKPLIYWLSKPVFDYIHGIKDSFKEFVKSAVTHPQVRSTMFFLQKFLDDLKRRLPKP
ncbi:MAG: patatin-like phospholipase family protein [Oligoflexales bacterium]